MWRPFGLRATVLFALDSEGDMISSEMERSNKNESLSYAFPWMHMSDVILCGELYEL